MDKIIIIDTETGGLNPNTDALCSISVKELNKNEVKTFYIQPHHKSYKKEALDVNKLTLDTLQLNGRPLHLVARDLYHFILERYIKNNNNKIMFIGQNLAFDLGFLKELWREFPEYDPKHLIDYHYYDTMHIALTMKLMGIYPEDKKVNLITLYEHFGGDLTIFKAHTSEGDVLATEFVFNKMQELLKNIKNDKN